MDFGEQSQSQDAPGLWGSKDKAFAFDSMRVKPNLSSETLSKILFCIFWVFYTFPPRASEQFWHFLLKLLLCLCLPHDHVEGRKEKCCFLFTFSRCLYCWAFCVFGDKCLGQAAGGEREKAACSSSGALSLRTSWTEGKIFYLVALNFSSLITFLSQLSSGLCGLLQQPLL